MLDSELMFYLTAISGAFMRLNILSYSLITLTAVVLTACGGSSGNDGIVFQGELTQGGVAAHSMSLSAKHGAGEKIEMVEICALGECSTTDDGGNWGFVAPEVFTGGAVEFSIKGHGIDTLVSLTVPEGAQDVFVHFERGEGSSVKVHHLVVDGVKQ
jgi:hypothetical protein